MTAIVRTAGFIAAAWCVGGIAIALGNAAESSVPTYTAVQAQRGEAVYMERCSGCHGPHLDDGQGDGAPALAGQAFVQHWGGKGLDEPFSVMSTQMPLDAPGGLDAGTYADLLAFILRENGIAPSTTELPSDPEKLKHMILPAGTQSPPGDERHSPRTSLNIERRGK